MKGFASFGSKSKPDAEMVDDGAEEGGEPEAASLSSMAGRKAAKNILAAIESGDSAALDKALTAHYEACSGE